ncbi:MAG: DUF1559 domain-containing protein [Planctomycetia bacterium]
MTRRSGFSVSRRRAGRQADGFTLVELLVVIAIIGALVGLLLPAVQAARESGRRMQCGNNLKQIGVAIGMAHDAKKVYPTGRKTRDNTDVGWPFRLLPYLEEQALFDAWNPALPASDVGNSRAMRNPVAAFFCASRRGPVADRNFDNNNGIPPANFQGVAAGGDYAANAGTYFNYSPGANGTVDPKLEGPIHTMSNVKAAQVIDGLSKTFAVGDRHLPPSVPGAGSMDGYNRGDTAFFPADTPHTLFRDTYRGLADSTADTNNRKFGSRHPGVTQFVFLDGHVDALDNGTPRDILKMYSAIGDGDDPSDPGDGTDLNY